jgi:DNA helicase HerA-like ATPase
MMEGRTDVQAPLAEQKIDDSERRDPQQRRGRQLGWVVSCTGSSAVINAPLDANAPTMVGWSIGNLVTIGTPESRVIGFVRSIESSSRSWAREGYNELLATIDLVGEVRENEKGEPFFQRGINCYPHLGAEAFRIRQRDLQAVYKIDSSQAIEVGRLAQDQSIGATIDMENMLKRHFAVVGSTGVGKSTAVTILVRGAMKARPKLRVLMLDPHNEFAAAFQQDARVLDAKTFELPFWMLKFEEMVEVVFRGRAPNDDEIDFLRESIEAARAAYLAEQRAGPTNSLLRRSFREGGEVVTADRPTPYRLTDIYTQIDEEVGRLESRYNRYDLKNLRSRIKEVADDPNFSFMFGKASVDDSIETVLGRIYNLPDNGQRITVLQLAGIPSEAVNAVVSVLARLSFDVAMFGGADIETLLVCEEAHRYIPNDVKMGFGPTRRAIARIAKEGRKYGSYISIVTQRPGELDPTILSQCSTVFAMRLTNEADQEIIRSAISDSSSGILAFLSAIGNREAIAFGEAISTPMRMKFVEIETTQRPTTVWLDRAANQRAVEIRDIISRMRGMEPTNAPVASNALPQTSGAPAENPSAETPAQPVAPPPPAEPPPRPPLTAAQRQFGIAPQGQNRPPGEPPRFGGNGESWPGNGGFRLR